MMQQIEYDLAIAVLLLKQAIENFEKVCQPPIPPEIEKKRYRPKVDPFMKSHSNEVKVYRIEEMAKNKKRTLS